MILSDLRDYLKQRPSVALVDLVNHFNCDADALRGMMQRWFNKGNLRKLSNDKACGTTCCKCDPNLTEIYQWIDNSV